MNYLELQQRANLLVQKVNNFEAGLEGTQIDETETLNQHIYADIYCLRPVLKMLFGSTLEEKLNRTLDNDVALRVFATSAPMWNSSFNLLSYNRGVETIQPSIGSNVVAFTTNELKYFKAENTPINPLGYSTSENGADYLGNNLYLKITTGEDVNSLQYIAECLTGLTFSIQLQNGSITGHKNNYSCTMISAVQPNTDYYLRVGQNTGDTTRFYIAGNIDGPWTEVGQVTPSQSYIHSLYLGTNASQNTPFLGTIDLTVSKANIAIYNTAGTRAIADLENNIIYGFNYTNGAKATIVNNYLASFNNSNASNLVSYTFSNSQVPEGSNDFLRLHCRVRLGTTSLGSSSIYSYGTFIGYQINSSGLNFQLYPQETTRFSNNQIGDEFDLTLQITKVTSGYRLNLTATRLRDNLSYSCTRTDTEISSLTMSYGISNTTKFNNFPFFLTDVQHSYAEIYRASQEIGFESDQHEFMNNIDMYNQYNMIQLDAYQNTIQDRDSRVAQGLNFSYSSNIQDALVTESQVANLFKWNTTSTESIQNNSMTLNRQVPGIVLYYLGTDYDGTYTATIPYNPRTDTINAVNYATPSYYGAYYNQDDITTSQVGPNMGHEACRIFMLGMNYTRGELNSPQQIWQPDRLVGEANVGYGFNWQGSAVYHELVFKSQRAGSADAGADFIPAISSDIDNDPQGLAMRTALAQQKEFYHNRPWFNELDELYNTNTRQLAESIINSQEYTDDEDYFTNFKLDYKTWATALSKQQ